MPVVEHGSFSIDTVAREVTCHKCGGHDVFIAHDGIEYPNDPSRWTAQYGPWVPVLTLRCNTCGNEVIEED